MLNACTMHIALERWGRAGPLDVMTPITPHDSPEHVSPCLGSSHPKRAAISLRMLRGCSPLAARNAVVRCAVILLMEIAGTQRERGGYRGEASVGRPRALL